MNTIHRLSLLSLILLFFGQCMIPLASKNLLRLDLGVKAPRVEIEETGTWFVLSILPIREPLDTKEVLLNLMQAEGCRDLKNIDIQYWNHTYYLVSWDKVRIIADCIKGAPPIAPPAAKPVVPAPAAADDAP